MGVLYIVATPIGNLEDITIRAIKTLLSVSVIACEDTRHTRILINLLKERYGDIKGILPDAAAQGPLISLTDKKKFLSVRDWNEAKVVDLITGELVNRDVALVSDAGTPLISDPGFKVVRAAREAGFNVSPIPGSSAVTAALSASGLPTNKFIFLGFLGKRWELLPGYTHVIYESPVRLGKTIEAIRSKWPSAEIVVAREMTKIHERITYDVSGIKENLKGEVTLLVYVRDVGEKVAADHRDRSGDL